MKYAQHNRKACRICLRVPCLSGHLQRNLLMIQEEGKHTLCTCFMLYIDVHACILVWFECISLQRRAGFAYWGVCCYLEVERELGEYSAELQEIKMCWWKFLFKRRLASSSQDVNANGLSKTAEIKLGISHSRKRNLIIEWSWKLFKFWIHQQSSLSAARFISGLHCVVVR